MEKFKINVPAGIRYMSDWDNFLLPNHPHIMNKVVTGCGFTEYFLRPNLKYPKVILVSPRRVLLENKEDQHNNPKDGIDIGSIYYAKNDLEVEDKDYDIDLNSSEKKLSREEKEQLKKQIKDEIIKEKVLEFKKKLNNYVIYCQLNRKDIRIIVTYDSFRLVKETLGHSINDYQIVIDEFQSLLQDSVFKSDTELTLLQSLFGLNKICFLSATPMLDKYMERLSSFKDLPYYELDWEGEQPNRIHRPNLECGQCVSIITEAVSEINRYLNKDFERCSWRDEFGNIQEKYSTELVIYCNSVKNICDIIRKCNLRPDQLNILCAQTEDNRKKINQAIKAVDPSIPTRSRNYIGTVPQKGQPHKMFTFCTRTVYLGADFYSECARSLILSDANIECLAVDISMDLIQILGRQRLDENPWKNSAMFRYKTNTTKITQEEFNNILSEKIRRTESLLNSYNLVPIENKHDLANIYQSTARREKYKNNYVAVNTHVGSDLQPCFNELVLVAEQRAFDIQQIDYKNRFSVITEITNKVIVDDESDDITNFLQSFESLRQGRDKMKYLCEFLQNKPNLTEEILMNIPLTYKNYYIVLGPSRCYAFSYQMCKLESEYQKQLNNQSISSIDLQNLIYNYLKEGEKYLQSDLKDFLQNIYNQIGLKKTGKASDLEGWFELKRVNITDPATKKRLPGYKLIKRKY